MDRLSIEEIEEIEEKTRIELIQGVRRRLRL